MEPEPWESLHVDHSHLSNFLRPCNSKTLTTDTPLIPGPAGLLQTAMIQRRTLGASNTLPTQEFVKRVVQYGHDTDLDFNASPWLSASQFLRSSQVDHVACATPLSLIKKHLNGEGRVALVVAVINSCTPNGFGDMTVTLKDPTGTIGASIHRKVLAKKEFGKAITVGSVLLLQKVAVFSPNGSTYYLNITLSNIVMVFSKESGAPSEEISVRQTVPTSSAETHEKSGMSLSGAFSLPQERTKGILNNLRLDSRFREVADDGKQIDENLVLSSCHFDNGIDKNQRSVSDRENLSLRQDGAGRIEVTCGGVESEIEAQQNHPKAGEGDNLVGIAQANSSSSNSIDISVGQETGMERQKETTNPISSIPQWTDEQLDELLAFD